MPRGTQVGGWWADAVGRDPEKGSERQHDPGGHALDEAGL